MRYHEMDGILIERVAGADFSDSAILRARSARPTRSCRPRSSGEEGTGDRRKGYDALRRAQIAHKRGAVGPDGGGLHRTARPSARVQDRTISDAVGRGRTVTGSLFSARFTVRVRAPEPHLNSGPSKHRPDHYRIARDRAHLSRMAQILTQPDLRRVASRGGRSSADKSDPHVTDRQDFSRSDREKVRRRIV